MAELLLQNFLNLEMIFLLWIVFAKSAEVLANNFPRKIYQITQFDFIAIFSSLSRKL